MSTLGLGIILSVVMACTTWALNAFINFAVVGAEKFCKECNGPKSSVACARLNEIKTLGLAVQLTAFAVGPIASFVLGSFLLAKVPELQFIFKIVTPEVLVIASFAGLFIYAGIICNLWKKLKLNNQFFVPR